jgi:hypothetical protein
MSRHREPTLVADRPLLEWLDDAVDHWTWGAERDAFGPGIPPAAMTATGLRRWLLADSTPYPTRDRAWAHVIIQARGIGSDGSRDDEQARAYRLLALGLALPGLRGYRRRIPVRGVQDVADVHADIVTGFLIRLDSIDPTGHNLAGRLIDSAIGYAARRHQLRPADPLVVPVDPEVLTTLTGRLPGQYSDAGTDGADVHGETLQDCLARHAGRLRAVGARLPDLDLELIARTRLDGVPITEAAARLGIPLQAAYKRRQRAEQRLSVALQHSLELGSTVVVGAGRAASGRSSRREPTAASVPVA